MKLLTAKQRKQLIKNYGTQTEAVTSTVHPVVKIFCPWGAGTWLFSEMNPENDMLFGICDMGIQEIEYGYVSLKELEEITSPWGMKLERDRYFTTDKPIGEHYNDSKKLGRIDA